MVDSVEGGGVRQWHWSGWRSGEEALIWVELVRAMNITIFGCFRLSRPLSCQRIWTQLFHSRATDGPGKQRAMLELCPQLQ